MMAPDAPGVDGCGVRVAPTSAGVAVRIALAISSPAGTEEGSTGGEEVGLHDAALSRFWLYKSKSRRRVTRDTPALA